MKLDVQFEIEPYKGINGIQFGMTREQIRAALDAPVKSFRKTPTDKFDTDACDRLGIQIFYKHPDICEAIEFGSPANPTFQKRALIGQPFSTLRNWFQAIDPDIDVDDTGLTSYQYGIGLYAPFAFESPNEPVEGVIIFDRSYYDI